MTFSVSSKFSARGTGRLTIAQLQSVVEQFPPDATISKVEIGDSQRDGAWWAVEAEIRTQS